METKGVIMEDLELRRFEMFKRVEELGATYAPQFPPGTYGANLFSALSAVIKKLDNHFQAHISQRNIMKSGTVSKSVAKSALLVEMKSIRNNASIMEEEITGIEEKFSLPLKLKEQELLSLAKGFARHAALYEQQFIDHEMPADFLARLNAHIDAFETAIGLSASANDEQIANTAAVDDSIEQGMNLVDRIGVVMDNRFHDDKLIMQAWRTARHVDRARASKPKPKPDPETTPSPAESPEK